MSKIQEHEYVNPYPQYRTTKLYVIENDSHAVIVSGETAGHFWVKVVGKTVASNRNELNFGMDEVNALRRMLGRAERYVHKLQTEKPKIP
jgi:uncharacterized protein (UPF0216 family)